MLTNFVNIIIIIINNVTIVYHFLVVHSLAPFCPSIV